ncbi:FeoA family protein [Companilactobacillus baiquanensis]|uniref:Ferrous iron transport protein A n=1 Tax=Companilactobacillus baiquanensis TaxID=2486005 RepID=A0ABW1UU65_9LACO|nr:FeoA family protein [Companilactobacillus baiquanensis]
MQLISEQSINKSYYVKDLDYLDDQTKQRLHSLGIHVGSQMTIMRFLPFHGPVIVEIDHQKIGLRYAVFKLLMGGIDQ